MSKVSNTSLIGVVQKPDVAPLVNRISTGGTAFSLSSQRAKAGSISEFQVNQGINYVSKSFLVFGLVLVVCLFVCFLLRQGFSV